MSEVNAELKYVGNELHLFAHARNWKRYWMGAVAPFVGQRVLEVGAGIGSNTLGLIRPGVEWTCLEPDGDLLEELRHRLSAAGVDAAVRHGTLASLPAEPRYDTILYIDVLEHIEDDSGELQAAVRRLIPGGRIIILAPAFERLYSPFDRAIGHHRRYTRKTLQAAAPQTLRLETSFYLDAVGALSSLANRLALRQAAPGAAQIALWDRLMIPCSRVLDPVLGNAVGRSVLAVWQRTQREDQGQATAHAEAAHP